MTTPTATPIATTWTAGSGREARDERLAARGRDLVAHARPGGDGAGGGRSTSGGPGRGPAARAGSGDRPALVAGHLGGAQGARPAASGPRQRAPGPEPLR